MRILRQLQLLLAPRRIQPEHAVISDQFLYQIWCELRREFFPLRSELDSYRIVWSSRAQKRVLASCNIRRRKVVVARELLEPSALRWIAPVLYHELCHAVIGEQVDRSRSNKRLWHGAQFRELENRHPDIKALHAWISSGGWALAVRSEHARSFVTTHPVRSVYVSPYQGASLRSKLGWKQ